MLKEHFQSPNDRKVAGVRAHPRLVQNKRTLRLSLYCLGIYVLLVVIAVVYEQVYHERSILVAFLLANPNLLLWLGIMCLLMSIFSRGRIKYFERKRQAVARGETLPLAEPQPASALQGQEIVAPIVLEYRTNRSMLLTIFLCATIALLLVLTVNIRLQFSAMAIAAFLSVWLFFGTFSLWMGIFRTGQQLRADEHGLTLTQPWSKKVQAIPWRDARLFAIDEMPGGDSRIQKSRPPFLFELASEQEVICWFGNLRERPNVVAFSQPVLTNDEYLQQLQRLHVLIAQKTGLPLVDLRGKY